MERSRSTFHCQRAYRSVFNWPKLTFTHYHHHQLFLMIVFMPFSPPLLHTNVYRFRRPTHTMARASSHLHGVDEFFMAQNILFLRVWWMRKWEKESFCWELLLRRFYFTESLFASIKCSSLINALNLTIGKRLLFLMLHWIVFSPSLQYLFSFSKIGFLISHLLNGNFYINFLLFV